MFSKKLINISFWFCLAVSLSFFSLSCDEFCTCTSMDCSDGIFVKFKLPANHTSADIDLFILLWREGDSGYTEAELDMVIDEEYLQWNIDDSLLPGRIKAIDLQLVYENEIIQTNTDQILKWESFECNDCTGGCKDVQYSATIELKIE